MAWPCAIPRRMPNERSRQARMPHARFPEGASPKSRYPRFCISAESSPMRDIDPEFAFDGAGDQSSSVPWEASGVLEASGTTAQFGTSIDHKIAEKLSKKKAKKPTKKASKVSRTTDGAAGKGEPLSKGHRVKPDPNSPGEPSAAQDEGASGPDAKLDLQDDCRAATPPTNDEAASASFEASSFEDLQLSRPLLKACSALGFRQPTPIQAACIPLALMGRDISGSAITGSGKTAAYCLPILDRLLYRSRKAAVTYVLILTPTRELAVQVHGMMQQLAQFTDVRIALVVGGLSLQVQAATLRTNPDVVIATPGRLVDHLRNTQSVSLEDLQALVLDEADRLLQSGFSDELRELLRLLPRRRQTLLFSATMTSEVQQLAALSLQKPVRLAADPEAMVPKTLVQEVVRVKGQNLDTKEAMLVAMCARSFAAGGTLVFFRTKRMAHRAKMLFGLCGLPQAGELHGDMTQTMRLESLDRFRKGEVAFLLASDVAARGLDIAGVETVINYDAPTTAETYLHRVGRTARAGRRGRSITFVGDDDRKLMRQVLKRQRVRLQERLTPPAMVRQWAARIQALAPDIQQLVQEEQEERQMRKAQVEVDKAENLLVHEAEIFSRPARTWFQTSREKRAARSADAAPAAGAGSPVAAEEASERKHKRVKTEPATRSTSKKTNLMQETGQASGGIRSSKARESNMRAQGLSPAQARRVLAEDGGKKKKPTKKRMSQRHGGGEGEAATASALGASRAATKVYAGGRQSGKAIAGTPGRGKKVAHTGGKGSRAFKSKGKHKRR